MRSPLRLVAWAPARHAVPSRRRSWQLAIRSGTAELSGTGPCLPPILRRTPRLARVGRRCDQSSGSGVMLEPAQRHPNVAPLSNDARRETARRVYIGASIPQHAPQTRKSTCYTTKMLAGDRPRMCPGTRLSCQRWTSKRGSCSRSTAVSRQNVSCPMYWRLYVSHHVAPSGCANILQRDRGWDVVGSASSPKLPSAIRSS